MQMEPQVSLDQETNIHHENIKISECGCGGTSSTQKLDEQPPASSKAKKTTRRWAAWTRQEEEMFFNGLRQYGKNFEMITARVPSKNKDQVRHYYYRLFKRMNKLLGPEVTLDAGNHKDTNAAMLRWWSLLEKQSCKSSKLHLKPRRFKIFLETLENQLLKDRKKHKRKNPSQRENCSHTTPIVISNQGRASVHDGPAVRLVLVDSQNIQQSNSAKDVPLKRNPNIGVSRRNCKSDSFPALPVRQRRKSATTSKAALKKWEKAAIAGVSLVADAAEHLERTNIDKEVDQVQGEIVSNPSANKVPSCAAPSQIPFVDSNAQTNSKLKLQLFPVDEGTRKALEMDTHNPHLELTLSTRKKISSVLEHLHRKWGNSSVASGELMLFPYYASSDNLAGYLRWTQDSVLSAGEVYALVGSPALFRLRYGWCSSAELASATVQAPIVSSGMISNINMKSCNGTEQNKNQMQVPTPIDRHDKDQQVSENPMDMEPCSAEVPNELGTCIGVDADKTLPQSSVFCDGRETSDGDTLRESFSKDNMELRSAPPLSAGEWADSLTSISVGDLLADVSNNGIDPLPIGSSQPQQVPFSCDSFDAAIAAHIYGNRNKTSFTPALSPFEASIWEAEETCDAFSFQKSAPRNEVQETSLACYGANLKGSLEMEVPMEENPIVEEPMDQCQSEPGLENSPRNINNLTDMYWTDSLGPLDLDIPKYHNDDLLLSDSLSGLSRLLGNSLDAFQNCSLFGFDKRETTVLSGVEAQEGTSFSDYKISSGVMDFAKA